MDRAAAEQRTAELVAEYGSPDACPGVLLCDRHPSEAAAFTVVEPDLSYRDLTFGELGELSARFAASLAALGVGPGDAVATLMGKSAELVVALLGIWRRGAVHVPLFTAFAPPAVEFRLARSGAKVVVADEDQRAKLDPGGGMPGEPPWPVISGGRHPGDLPLAEMMSAEGAAPRVEPAVTGPAAPLVLIFTSGTTGAPKGVPVPVRALAGISCYMEYGLDVQPEDAYWNAADPGWAYGLFYAILGPLATGRRSILLHAGFSPALTWQVLERFGVTNFAAAPTIYRAMRASGGEPAHVRLRRASSAGEPLTPDIVTWSKAALGTEVRDHYGQTEHGMIIVNGWHDDVRAEVRPGSMGQPLPGFSCAVLHDDPTSRRRGVALSRVHLVSFLPEAGMTEMRTGSEADLVLLPDDHGCPGPRSGHAWRRVTGGSGHGWRSDHHGPQRTRCRDRGSHRRNRHFHRPPAA